MKRALLITIKLTTTSSFDGNVHSSAVCITVIGVRHVVTATYWVIQVDAPNWSLDAQSNKTVVVARPYILLTELGDVAVVVDRALLGGVALAHVGDGDRCLFREAAVRVCVAVTTTDRIILN